MLNVSLLLRTASQARPVVGTISVWGGVDVFLRSTSLEGGLAPFEVTSVILRAEEGKDDNVSSDDTDEDTLDEGIVRYDLGTSLCLNCGGMLITTSCGNNEAGKENGRVGWKEVY